MVVAAPKHPEIWSRVGARIAHLRALSDVTQAQLAAASKLGQSDLSRIERGAQALRFDQAYAIARVLGVSLDALVTGEVGRVDPYANRRDMMSTRWFAALPDPVKRAVAEQIRTGGDLSFVDWVLEAERLRRDHARGDL